MSTLKKIPSTREREMSSLAYYTWLPGDTDFMQRHWYSIEHMRDHCKRIDKAAHDMTEALKMPDGPAKDAAIELAQTREELFTDHGNVGHNDAQNLLTLLQVHANRDLPDRAEELKAQMTTFMAKYYPYGQGHTMMPLMEFFDAFDEVTT